MAYRIFLLLICISTVTSLRIPSFSFLIFDILTINQSCILALFFCFPHPISLRMSRPPLLPVRRSSTYAALFLGFLLHKLHPVLQHFNLFAFAHVAFYGKPYFQAARAHACPDPLVVWVDPPVVSWGVGARMSGDAWALTTTCGLTRVFNTQGFSSSWAARGEPAQVRQAKPRQDKAIGCWISNCSQPAGRLTTLKWC